jgi:primary-amine oxidase
MGLYQRAVILTILVLAGCGQSSTQTQEIPLAVLSPWHSLTAVEINEASAAVSSAFGSDVIFNRISLTEPDKERARSWEAGQSSPRSADVIYRLKRTTHRVQYDFENATISEPQEITSGQPMLMSEELLGAIEVVNQLPEVIAVLEQRGITGTDGLCLPRTVGRFFADIANPVNDRLMRFDCFNIRGQSGLGLLPTSSAFARPVEGFSILFDIEQLELIELTDAFKGSDHPPNDFEVIEFHESALDTRPALKPMVITQPEGQNFEITGSQINWQGWQFHLRFDPRQGTILNNIGVVSDQGFRPVAYEIAMSEMFVPYQDPDAHWFYRAYFDMGEYGFGNMATELKGSDCPSTAVYQDVVLHTANGDAFTAENRICIFEFDPGYPSWRHHESMYNEVPGIVKHNSRPATNLVVRMVAVIGNYDYFQDYIFQQDGRIRIRLISTGIDATKGVFSASLDDARAAEETQTGTLIAPYRLGVNHDHFFSYRIDMDVDGVDNTFVRQRLVSAQQPTDAPRQGIWKVHQERVLSEQQAQTTMKVDKPALLTFRSSTARNEMGYPTSYQLMFPNTHPLVTMDDVIYQRAGFLKNNLWVTRYKRDELFSTGLAVNQSDVGQGLPQYAADNEAIEDTDLVAWPMIGFHHVPMAEDWPVMPAKVDEITLKPRNFFNRNPALDVPE